MRVKSTGPGKMCAIGRLYSEGSAVRQWISLVRLRRSVLPPVKRASGSISPPADSYQFRRRIVKRTWILALALAAPTAAFAKACNKNHPTPENPTLVLAAIGGAAISCKSLIYRLRK